MPLPVGPNSQWPPESAKQAQRDVAEWDAWYSGDPLKLAAVMSNPARPPSQRRSIWATLRQQQDQPSKPVHAVHLPAASDIAATSADLLFGDMPTLKIPEAHEDTADPEAKKAEERLHELIELEAIDTTLLEAADACSGLGGVYLRVGWNEDIADHPLLDCVHPDFAVPTFVGRHLRAVTFWRVVQIDGQAVWRHLECHESGGITHGLFIGTMRDLGSKVKLDAHESTKGIAADDEGRVDVPQGVTGLMVRYIPNAPNRKRRDSREGAADCAHVVTEMDALDLVWSSWMRDIRLGQSRIMVDQAALNRLGRGSGASFDEDQEVFVGLELGPGSAERQPTIEVAEFTIRAADHEASARALFESITRSAGYSPQTFGMKGDGAEQTATEVDAKENRSDRTTYRKRRYWGGEVEDIAEIMLIVDREVFEHADIVPMRPRLDWPEIGGDDLAERADTVSKLELARAVSTETKVRLIHPEWESEQVKAEVEAIHAEQGIAMPDPTGTDPKVQP